MTLPIDMHMLSVWFLPCLFAATLHEAAHAYAAWYCGDPTARLQGRCSLNPLAHIDIIGTIVLPLTLLLFKYNLIFAWGKPIPIISRYFKHPKRHHAFVALCGPAANLLMACLWALLLNLTLSGYLDLFGNPLLIAWLKKTCDIGIFINACLFVFNLLPIPPLDGSKCLAYILPYPWDEWYQSFEEYGMIIIFIVFYYTSLHRTVNMLIVTLYLLISIAFRVI